MKKIALLAILSIAAFTTVQAQSKSNSAKATAAAAAATETPIEQSAKAETDKLDKLVRLTAEQKAKISDINLSLARRESIVTSNKNNTAEENQRAISEIRNARINAYMQSLTPDQGAKYKASLMTESK
jgi:hypothetical protein